MRTCLSTCTALILAATLAACGGNPKPSTSKKNSKPTAPALLADIQAAAATGYQPKDAVITYAIFTRGAIKDAEGRVRTALVSPKLKGVVQGAPMMPSVVTHAASDLPIRIEALAQGPHAAAIQSASHATFVHSVGPTGPNQARLRWAALAAHALASDGIVVDMATREAWTQAEFESVLTADSFVDEQLKVIAYKESPTTVIYHTEGMAKLGLPDVEMGGVPLETAKLAYAGFQATVDEIRARGWVTVGDTVKMATLGKCERPAVTITHECVRLIKTP